VFVSVETDQTRGDPIPYRTGRYALSGQEHSLGHAKSWVAQHATNQFVAQYFRAMSPDGDRCTIPGPRNESMRLVRIVQLLIRQDG
jgi:hypothetical protein